MSMKFLRAGCIGTIAFLLLVHASCAQATTSPAGTPVTATDCTVSMRPASEWRLLIMAALPQISATFDGTPVATVEASPQPALDLARARPADAAMVNAANAVVRQLAGCTNAGQLGALLSLYDDEGAAAYGALAYLTFARGIYGDRDPADPALLDLFLGSLQLAAPLPEQDRITAYHLDRAVVLPDDLIYATASFARGGEPPSQVQLWLREEQGQLHIVFDPDDNVDLLPAGAPTPVAS